MRKRTKLKIGEFSKLMQVTVKTLRHYEQIGLLVLDEVDQWSGYRYYTLDQMQKLKSIRQLKDIGFSLVEIKDIYDDDYHEPSIRQIKAKLTECNRQIRMLQRRRQQLIDIASSHKNIKTMEKFGTVAKRCGYKLKMLPLQLYGNKDIRTISEPCSSQRNTRTLCDS